MRFFACALSSAAIGGVLFAGCADPAAPLPQGGWSLSFVDTGATCDIKSHNGAVGTVTATGETKLVTDGVGGAEVKCSVEPSGGGFKVDGRVLAMGSNLHVAIDDITKDASQDAPATGSVAYISSETQNAFGSTADMPCRFYFLDAAEKVSAGNIWVAFECDAVVYESQTCALKAGYIKLAHCDGEVVE
jgi:hypothetical protein